MDILTRDTQGAADARRSVLLELQRSSIDSGARLQALNRLRELEGLESAPPANFVPSRAQAARREERDLRNLRITQLEELSGGKVYMHHANVERLKQTAAEETHAKFRADVLEQYQRNDADWGLVAGRSSPTAGEKAAAKAMAEKAAAEAALADGVARDADGDIIDDEGDADDEEFEFYAARSKRRIILALQTALVLTLLGVVAGLIFTLHMRVYSCNFGVGLPGGGGYTKTLHRNFTALNVKRLFVYKNRGHVVVSMDDLPGVRVAVTHHARTFEAMSKIESRIYQESGMISVLSNWEAAMDEGFDCPQADVHLTIPRAIADGILRSRVIWDPDALGPGRGAYLEPEPVPVENRPHITVVVNATDPRSWLLPRRGDIHVELMPDVVFANMSLRSNVGNITTTTFLGDYVNLSAAGGDVNVSLVRATRVETYTEATEFYPRVHKVWPWVALAMWPDLQRTVGTVYMHDVTTCPKPCSGWAEQRKAAAEAALPGTSDSKHEWLDSRASWLATAYYEFAGHVAAHAFDTSDDIFWNGAPSCPNAVPTVM